MLYMPLLASKYLFWRICMLFFILDDVRYQKLAALRDRAFSRALPNFSTREPCLPRRWRINLCWLFPWAVADQTGGRRFSYIAPAVRTIWPEFAVFNDGNFLQMARQNRYA
jgi:hypothetical protein